MQRFYSQATGTTYFKEIHGDIPSDALLISEDRYKEVITNPAPGKVRAHDENGLPILIDPPPSTADELATAERSWRDAEIENWQWLRERHRDEIDSARPTSMTVEQSVELLDYVQALRDWPQSSNFPGSQYRPEAPSWLTDQSQ